MDPDGILDTWRCGRILSHGPVGSGCWWERAIESVTTFPSELWRFLPNNDGRAEPACSKLLAPREGFAWGALQLTECSNRKTKWHGVIGPCVFVFRAGSVVPKCITLLYRRWHLHGLRKSDWFPICKVEIGTEWLWQGFPGVFLYVILIKISATGVSLKEVCSGSLVAQEAESSSLRVNAHAVCVCTIHSEPCPQFTSLLTFRWALAMADTLSFLALLTCRTSNISLAQWSHQ